MFLKSILIFLLSSGLYASSYAVVVNKSSKLKNLSLKEIRDVYFMKRHFIKGEKLVPVNIASNASLRLIFEEKVLKMNRRNLNAFWVKQHFQGVKPPLTQSSLKSMRLFIKNVDEAIGYLPIEMVESDMRVLYEF